MAVLAVPYDAGPEVAAGFGVVLGILIVPVLLYLWMSGSI